MTCPAVLLRLRRGLERTVGWLGWCPLTPCHVHGRLHPGGHSRPAAGQCASDLMASISAGASGLGGVVERGPSPGPRRSRRRPEGPLQLTRARSDSVYRQGVQMVLWPPTRGGPHIHVAIGTCQSTNGTRCAEDMHTQCPVPRAMGAVHWSGIGATLGLGPSGSAAVAWPGRSVAPCQGPGSPHAHGNK